MKKFLFFTLAMLVVLSFSFCHHKTKKSTDRRYTTVTIALSVDYTKTIEQAIVDGKYNDYETQTFYKEYITTKNFPVSQEMIGKKATINVALFYFDDYLSSEIIIFEMDKRGYRPAILIELLAFGATYPELQTQFPIAALGSLWLDAPGGASVPYLDGRDGKRSVGLYWSQYFWKSSYRFLGVPK